MWELYKKTFTYGGFTRKPGSIQKGMDVLEYIHDTVTIQHRFKPLYNFKAID